MDTSVFMTQNDIALYAINQVLSQFSNTKDKQISNILNTISKVIDVRRSIPVSTADMNPSFRSDFI